MDYRIRWVGLRRIGFKRVRSRSVLKLCVGWVDETGWISDGLDLIGSKKSTDF
jgi:hypothetical protein